MLEQHMVVPCLFYKAVLDKNGDVRAVEPLSTTIWFRDIEGYQHSANRDEDTAAAMAWLRPSTEASEGDILTVYGQSYRIIGVTAARRLGDATVQFIKCTLERFESFVS